MNSSLLKLFVIFVLFNIALSLKMEYDVTYPEKKAVSSSCGCCGVRISCVSKSIFEQIAQPESGSSGSKAILMPRCSCCGWTVYCWFIKKKGDTS